MTTIILDAQHVGKAVETTEKLTILQDISFQLNEGDSLAIIGSSGSGKSTLLGLLAGLDVPTEGEILLAGKPLSQMSEDQRASLRAEHVGFVFQSFQLLESLTAVENVMLPLELEGKKNARERAMELLQRVGLGERTHHYPKQLSGGEQQRVAIARAFASNPTILFADEPTGNLDTKTGESII
ncbi:MAG: ABC transporter ATP-binding protein, partial [Wohlfahrtiimonas sp.]